jgi:hypothetical protein
MDFVIYQYFEVEIYDPIAGTRGTDLPSPSPLFLYFFFITFCLHIYFQ